MQSIGVVISVDLCKSQCLVPGRMHLRSDRDITTIEHCRPAVEGVGLKWDVISTAASTGQHVRASQSISTY